MFGHVFLNTFDATRGKSLDRTKLALTAVTGAAVLAGIVSKLCRFEIYYKNTPNNKADCKALEPIDINTEDLINYRLV